MKVCVLKNIAMITVMTAIFVNTPVSANTLAVNNLLKVQPTAVYQAIHGQALADTLAQIAQRSGITFRINTDLSKDQVNQSIAADSWLDAIKELLVNYNYMLSQDGDTLKTVIISSRKSGTASEMAVNHPVEKVSSSVGQVLVVERQLKKLPGKYQSFPAGSVTSVKLPVSEMLKVTDQAKVGLDLPMGQFNVAHDQTVTEADGSQTWVGHLADEGKGYRVFMSQGAAGTMGIVTTPDGTYNIESDASGATYLVDTSKLSHAGYDGDALPAPTELMAAVTANAAAKANLSIADLQNAVTTTQTALNAANALVASDQATLNTLNAQLSIAQANRDAAYNQNLRACGAFFDVLKSSDGIIAAAAAAQSAWITAQNSLVTSNQAINTVNTTVNTIKSKLAVDSAAAAAALVAYNQAVADLNAAQLAATPATNGAGNVAANAEITTVDLMVVYTTVAQTQLYAKQRINLLVTASNQAYLDSHINMQLRLVHTEPTAYVENNSNAQALSDLANGAGVFNNIAQTRASYGADLVFLFRPLYARTAGSCGTTYLEFANGSAGNAGLGFGTIGDGNSVDVAGYYCAVNAFTHEIGHTLGLVHDRPNSGYVKGVFPYSYAWGVNGTFGTIMSYDMPVLMYFSTPTLPSQCAGQPCGYPQTDVARSSDQTSSVNYTAPIVANFMPMTTLTPVLQ